MSKKRERGIWYICVSCKVAQHLTGLKLSNLTGAPRPVRIENEKTASSFLFYILHFTFYIFTKPFGETVG
jgi:hypothetical protein